MQLCLFDSFLLSLPVLLVLLLLCATILFHNLVCTCVLHLSYVYFVTSSCHHSILVVFTNQSPSDYFTYHNPSHSFFWSQSITFMFIIFGHTHVTLSFSLIFTVDEETWILLKYIHSWANIANITWCQRWDANESR